MTDDEAVEQKMTAQKRIEEVSDSRTLRLISRPVDVTADVMGQE